MTPGENGSGGGGPSDGMTIEELAERTGMTPRNIRAHQSRGLLDPPIVRGRTGYYDAEHIARIELIRELQSEGFNLEAIRRIVESAGDSSGELLDFTRVVRGPFDDEEPEILTSEEIAGPWGGGLPDDRLMERVERLGLMRPLGDGRYEVISPKLLAAGVAMADLGIPPEVALDALEALRERSLALADLFTDIFSERIWAPFDRAGRPKEDWPEVRNSFETMRPIATEAFLAAFRLAMEEAGEKAISVAIRRDLDAT